MSQSNDQINQLKETIKAQLKEELGQEVLEKVEKKGIGKIFGKLTSSKLITGIAATLGIGGAGIGIGETQIASKILANLLPSTAIERNLESLITKQEFDQQFSRLDTIYVSQSYFNKLLQRVEKLEQDTLIDKQDVSITPSSTTQIVSEPAYITALQSKLESMHEDILACK